MASTPQRTISQRAVIVKPRLTKRPGELPAAAYVPRMMCRPRRGLKWRGHCQKRLRDATLEPRQFCIGFSAPGGVDGRAHFRQRPGTRPELQLAFHLSHVPFHLEASEPFDIAWEIDARSHTLLLIGR